MSDENLKICEAIRILNDKRNQTNDENLKKRIDILIIDLGKYFGEFDDVDSDIAKELKNFDTVADQADYNRIMNLHEKFIFMKRRVECRKFFENHRKIVDGETYSQWVTVISAICAIVISLGAIVFGGLNVIDVHAEGFWDKLGFIITFCGAAITIIVWIIAKIINRIYAKKRGNTYSFEELAAIKYENEPKKLRLICPAARRMRDCQFLIGKDNVQIKKYKPKAKTKYGDINQSIN